MLAAALDDDDVLYWEVKQKTTLTKKEMTPSRRRIPGQLGLNSQGSHECQKQPWVSKTPKLALESSLTNSTR